MCTTTRVNAINLKMMVEEFCAARFGRLQSLKEMIVEAGAAAVPFLLSSYHSTRITNHCCFGIILQMKPDAYVPILATAINKDKDGLAMLDTIEHYRDPLPEAIPLLVAGLESSDSDTLRGFLKAIAAQYPIIEIACPDQEGYQSDNQGNSWRDKNCGGQDEDGYSSL